MFGTIFRSHFIFFAAILCLMPAYSAPEATKVDAQFGALFPLHHADIDALGVLLTTAGTLESATEFSYREARRKHALHLREIFEKKSKNLSFTDHFHLLSESVNIGFLDTFSTRWIMYLLLSVGFGQLLENINLQSSTLRSGKKYCQDGVFLIRYLPLLFIIKQALNGFKSTSTRKNDALIKTFTQTLIDYLPKSYQKTLNDEQTFRRIMQNLIAPLWKKHHGKAHHVLQQLIMMGHTLLKETSTTQAASQCGKIIVVTLNTQKFIHEVVTPSTLIRQGVTERMFKRIVMSFLSASLLQAGYSTMKTFSAATITDQFDRQKLGATDFPLTFCFNFVLFASTFVHVLSKLESHNPEKAQLDYEKFLFTNPIIQDDQQAFYDNWFLPHWKALEGNLATVENYFEYSCSQFDKSFQQARAQ